MKNTNVPCGSEDIPSWDCSAKALRSNTIINYHVRATMRILEGDEREERLLSARIASKSCTARVVTLSLRYFEESLD